MVIYPTNHAADIMGIKARLETKEEINMREITHALLIIFAVFLATACTSHSKLPESQALDQVLADQDYQIGEEVLSISDIRLDDRIYVDPKNLIIPVEGGQHYLVALKEACYSLKTSNVALRNGTYRALKKFDRFATLYKGRTVATCWVDAIYLLEKKQ